MNNKAVKITLDIIMTVFMILLMDLSVTGAFWHEFLGLAVLGLFAFHLFLNRNWIKSVTSSIFKGTLPKKAGRMYALDVLLAVSISLAIVSGILISEAILPFLASANIGFWSAIHTSSAYASLIVISVHTGVHWKYIMAAFRKMFSLRTESRARTIVLRALAAMLVIIGIKNSFSTNIGEKLVQPLMNTDSGYDLTSVDKTADLIDTDSLSSKAVLVSTESVAVNEVTLEDYLGNLFCTACHKHCPLLSPRCGRGVVQARNAENQYYALLEQAQSESEQVQEETQDEEQSTDNSTETTADQNTTTSNDQNAGSQSSQQSGSQKQGDDAQSQDASTIISEGDYTVPMSSGSPIELNYENAENVNPVAPFTNYLPIMSIYVGGTYYLIDFAGKRKRS